MSPLRINKEPKPNAIMIDENPSQIHLSQEVTDSDYEQSIIKKLDQIDELLLAKSGIDDEIKNLRNKTIQIKNKEKIKFELNKRIEILLTDIIKILDSRIKDRDEEDDEIQYIYSSDTILRCIKISQEEIDD